MHQHELAAVPAHAQNNLSMYRRETDIEGRTIHSKKCRATHTRRDWSCHRCCQLMLQGTPWLSPERKYFKARLAA